MMNQFVEIINDNSVRANTSLVLGGVKAGSAEWSKHQFFPNKGVVGLVITDEAMGPEGRMYIIQCGEKLFVPILPNGVRYITEAEFRRRLANYVIVGKDTEERNTNSFSNDFMNYLDSMFRK
jgi:hypothetical protein